MNNNLSLTKLNDLIRFVINNVNNLLITSLIINVIIYY